MVKKNKYAFLLFFLLTFCVSSLGFSTWYFGQAPIIKTDIETSFGSVDNFDYKDTAFYLIGSEKTIPYTSSSGVIDTTSRSVSFSIEIEPYEIIEVFNNDVFVRFGLSYTAKNTLNIDIFNDKNTSILEDSLVFSLKNAPNCEFRSGPVTISTQKENEFTHYYAIADVYLYSKENPSIANHFKHYSSNNEPIIIDVFFNFDVIDEFTFGRKVNSINFEFWSSLKGKRI